MSTIDLRRRRGDLTAGPGSAGAGSLLPRTYCDGECLGRPRRHVRGSPGPRDLRRDVELQHDVHRPTGAQARLVTAGSTVCAAAGSGAGSSGRPPRRRGRAGAATPQDVANGREDRRGDAVTTLLLLDARHRVRRRGRTARRGRRAGERAAATAVLLLYADCCRSDHGLGRFVVTPGRPPSLDGPAPHRRHAGQVAAAP